MRAYERLLEYVKVHTTSDAANAATRPSTQRQFDLANRLAQEMRGMGFDGVRVDGKCYVYGFLSAAPGCEKAPALGFIAHMDTSPDCPGEGVAPILHPHYDGGDVTLPNGQVIDVARLPGVKRFTGETLITASGGTLLGADDKAGIAEILTACERVLAEGLPHGRLCVAFTPDEEIGTGVDAFDVAGFGADYAYTVDGAGENEVEYETFNAAAAKLCFTGVEVHPGAAKNAMVNALSMAVAFDGRLPADERPQHTEGYEGFFHLTALSGTVGKARAEYIIRDHDEQRFEARKQAMRDAAAAVEADFAPGSVALEVSDTYYNMGKVLRHHMHLVENAKQAIEAVGLAPKVIPMRGGTDGSHLSFMGLPCPNLGTGGLYFHGPSECISAEAMDRAVAVLLGVIGRYAGLDKAQLEAGA